MVKFVIATYMPEEGNVNSKDFLNNVRGTFAKEQQDLTVINLNNVSEETLAKYIETGMIDCFAFTPETLSDEKGKKVVTGVLKADLNLKRNTKFLNVYDGQDKDNVEKSVGIGNILLDEKYRGNITHLDISGDERLFSQNLKGMKNEAIKTREKLQEKETDIMELACSVNDQIRTGKDEYTATHIRSVAIIADAIATKMELSDEEKDILRVGALLHDIGKIDVSDSVLKKPSRLTNEEFKEMSSHVAFGEVELNQFDLGPYERAKLVAEQHHEKFDGRGYPRGLKGEEIDSLARILSLADSTQAMFGRDYQAGRTKDELIAELNRCAGTQFDPNMVGYLCEILEKEPESIYVSYDKDGKISYQAPDVRKVVENKEKEREKMADNMFKNAVVSQEDIAKKDLEYKNSSNINNIEKENPDDLSI